MHVRVDQARQQHAARAVHDPRPGGIGTDQPVLDHHEPVVIQPPPVEHAGVGQGDLQAARRAC